MFELLFDVVYDVTCVSCSDHYYTRIAWLENRVFVTWTNRAQNSTVYMIYDPDSAAAVKVVFPIKLLCTCTCRSFEITLLDMC